MKSKTDYVRAVVFRDLKQENRRVPLIKFWSPSKTISQRLKVFVQRQQADFYQDIGFPFGVEFHWLPTKRDWVNVGRNFIRWFVCL